MDSAPSVRLEAAKQLMALGRFEHAAAELRALLGDHPSFLQARYELAIACYRIGALDEAVERFATVAAVNEIGLRSHEFYDAILALPDHRKGLEILGTLLPRLPGATKMIEAYGRLLHKEAAAAGTPHGDIEVIGDSHAVPAFSPLVRCRVHFVGPRTLHYMSLRPIDLAGFGIAPDAKLVMVFGEIDCRSHMIEMAQRSGQSQRAVARRVASRFVRTLARAIERGAVQRAAICAILPPPPSYPDNPMFPAIGSAAERRDMAQILNDELAAAAAPADIGFLDFRAAYVGADGFLDPARSDGTVHIDFRLSGPVEASLNELFGPPPGG